MKKIDLHTHSTGSPDGGISVQQYIQTIQSGALDYIAVTDHDRIDIALAIQQELGDQIIVGQEVTSSQGELVGLYLKEQVKPGQTAKQTAQAIRAQGGIVYVPHPFETVRKGMTKATLDNIVDLVDIVEVHNGRAFFQNKGPLAATWAKLNNKAIAASSDAHGVRGLGTTFSTLPDAPSRANLVKQLSRGRLTTKRPPVSTLLYPKLNRLRGKIRRIR